VQEVHETVLVAIHDSVAQVVAVMVATGHSMLQLQEQQTEVAVAVAVVMGLAVAVQASSS